MSNIYCEYEIHSTFYSSCDNVKVLRNSVVVTKDDIDTDLEVKREETVAGGRTDEEAWEDKMDGDGDTSHHISFSNLKTHHLKQEMQFHFSCEEELILNL